MGTSRSLWDYSYANVHASFHNRLDDRLKLDSCNPKGDDREAERSEVNLEERHGGIGRGLAAAR